MFLVNVILNPQIYLRCTHTGEDRNTIHCTEYGKAKETLFLGIKRKTPSQERQPRHSLWKDPNLWLIESSTNWKPMRQYSSTWLAWSGKYTINKNQNNFLSSSAHQFIWSGRTNSDRVVFYRRADRLRRLDLCFTWWARCWKKRRRGAACEEMKRVLRLRGSKQIVDSR